MNRLFTTARCDILLQARNGFYAAAAFVLAVTAGGSLLLPTNTLRLGWLLPAAAINNLIITAFYFAGALVLLEKADGTLRAQLVTPLRAGEYLGAKALTLALLALAQNLMLGVALLRGTFNLVVLAAGVALGAAMMVLFGFAVAARHDALSTYLFPSVPWAAGLMLPVLPYVMGWRHWLFYLHPLQAPLELMRAAIAPVPAWVIAYGIGYGGLWVWLAFLLARRAFIRHIVK